MNLGQLDQAFLDAQRCSQLEPKNKAFQDMLRQLGAQIQQKVICSLRFVLSLKQYLEETVAN